MLDRPERLEAALLGGLRQMREQVVIGERTGIDEDQAEFHGGGSFVNDAFFQ